MKELRIIKDDLSVLSRRYIVESVPFAVPRTGNYIKIDGLKYQVTSVVFDYDLDRIDVWVK